MTIQLKVPSMACEGCAETITDAIKSYHPEAQIVADLSTKIVTIDTEASEETIKQIILTAGYTLE